MMKNSEEGILRIISLYQKNDCFLAPNQRCLGLLPIIELLSQPLLVFIYIYMYIYRIHSFIVTLRLRLEFINFCNSEKDR